MSLATAGNSPSDSFFTRNRSFLYLFVALIAGITYISCATSPPSLMDDTDAVQGQIAQNMVTSHDWVTPRVDGVLFLEKGPFLYWTMAVPLKIFGHHDWAARIPVVLSIIALCWLTTAFGVWAFGNRAGLYAGICISTCIGLWLFTRILIPDVMLTLSIALSMWAFLRALDDDETNPLFWSVVLGASMAVGFLLKSLIAIVFPVAAGLIYLAVARELFLARTWKRLHPFVVLIVALVIATPWHVLATLRNPPYFDFTMHSGPGEYHGFFWYYFINEQLLRFLNLRYPRDYNTVPRVYFWLFHLAWLFPWSVYFPAIAGLSYKPVDRAGRARLLALCWTGFLLIFFTFSTTQEYYSMPCYPAIALLLGSAMAMGGNWVRRGTRVLAVVAGIAAIAAFTVVFLVRNIPSPGDISAALSHHPKAYTLSLGHMEDLTLYSFAYLRPPLILAAIAFLIGALGTIRSTGERAYLAAALMMVLFFQAARLALIDFDPFLTSEPLAEVLLHSPEGKLITEGHYYPFSSIFFYTNRDGLLYSERQVNLEYGMNAPGAPQVFIHDADLKNLWPQPTRWYLVANDTTLPHVLDVVGSSQINVVATSGGKSIITNHPLTQPATTSH
jgi:4-amino-4-deoxy-L-arabinose transferase-like glycosyltransferase